MLVVDRCKRPRLTLSQFGSFEIRRTMFLNDTKSADLLILRLWNCERSGRAASKLYLPIPIAACLPFSMALWYEYQAF